MENTDKPLLGKKVAVILETEYVPSEIKTYQERFAELGAQVDLVSRLWGQSEATYVSDVDEVGKPIETIKVYIDIESIELDDYAAVIMAANYTSVRLRHIDDKDLPNGEVLNAESGRNAPVVKFFAKAMMNHKVIKGFPCHALWILSSIPEHLAGRKVICNRVMLGDVNNAGGMYTNSKSGIVVDSDIVTNDSASRSKEFVDVIAKQIKEAEAGNLKPVTVGCSEMAATKLKLPNPLRKRKILMLISEWGYWGEELVAPLEEFDKAGYETVFFTPTGKRPNAIAVSKDSMFIDPPLGRSVTSPEMAKKVQEIDEPTTAQGKRLQNPKSLADLMPDRPYWSAPQFVRQMEIYNMNKLLAEKELEQYDAMIIVGGSGPIVDLVNNYRVHDLILSFYKANKPIAAECYGVACLAFARNIEDRKSILWGKHVTGHCLEYDYKDGTGFMKDKDVFLDFNMGPAPYPLEYILRDATGPDGSFIGNFGHPTSVIVDYPFITGRSTPDSCLTGQKLIETLDGDPVLRRWGW